MSESPARTETDWTIGRLLAWTKDHFQKQDVDEPRLSAELLLAHAMECKRIELYARFDQSPSETQRAKYREMVKEAALHKPIAYLIGRKEFYSIEFIVNPAVLIPRPETELLVERVLAHCKEMVAAGSTHIDLLDIGTGSGCIAVATALRQKAIHAVATDKSEAALAVAEENVRKHGLGERIKLVPADFLEISTEHLPQGGFDVLVSNPPYIPADHPDTLAENVRAYEPSLALFGGADGLESYRKIAGSAKGVMKPSAVLLLEVGHDQSDAVEQIFTGTGFVLRNRYLDAAAIQRALEFGLAS